MTLSFKYPKGLVLTMLPRLIVLICLFSAAVYWLNTFELAGNYSGRVRFLWLHRGATYIVDQNGARIVVPYASNSFHSFWSAVEQGDSLVINDSIIFKWKNSEVPERFVVGR